MIAKWLKLYAIYAFFTLPDLCHYTTLLKADVLNFYLTLDLLQSDCSDLVSKWRGHTVATTFLLRSHCQTCTGYPGMIFLYFNIMTPRHISTWHRPFPGATERCEKCVVYKHLCSCMGHISSTNSDKFSRSVMTTNNSDKYTIFSLLCANSVVRYFVTNNKFQRYVTIENIWVSQGKAVTWVRLGGKYLYSIQFQPLCHLPTKTY